MNISIKKIRRSRWTKWYAILLIFLFLETSFCSVFQVVDGKFEIELSEKQLEDKLEKLEKDFEKEFEKNKISSNYSRQYRTMMLQNSYASLCYNANRSFVEIHLPPPECKSMFGISNCHFYTPNFISYLPLPAGRLRCKKNHYIHITHFFAPCLKQNLPV